MPSRDTTPCPSNAAGTPVSSRWPRNLSQHRPPMRICLIGGIFGKSAGYRQTIAYAPETILEVGLRDRGHQVFTFGHHHPVEFRSFDLVHVHHLAYGALVAASCADSVPLVFTSHALRRPRLPRRLAASYVLERATASVVLSEAEARWQRDEFPRMAAAQYIIPNGIDQTVFRHSPPRPPAASESWRLLYVGQLAPVKGVHFLLRALPLVAKHFDVELQLAYHIDTAEPALREEAHRLGLTNVRFLGPRRPHELAQLYADCHVLVLPSVSEALPTVISEALLVGRPVVATDVGGVRRQVGDFGTVVEPRSPQALANGLADVLARYSFLATQSLRASAAAADRYSIAAMLDAHEAMYRQCCDESAPRAQLGQRSVARLLSVLLPPGRRLVHARSAYRRARPRHAPLRCRD
jgi:glycosyltransferase involved in cell wall biosynthesis